MADSPYIFETGAHDFQSRVIDASMTQPILVDFWADWCQPCKSLMPVLARLADEYRGAFLLAKVNTDQEQALAMQFGIRSLPTVVLVSRGEIVDGFMGVQPESEIRQFLAPHVGEVPDETSAESLDGTDGLAAEINMMVAAGHGDAALTALDQGIQANPDDEEMPLLRIETLMQLGRSDEVRASLEALPITLRESDRAKAVGARLQFVDVLVDAPDRHTLEQRLEDNADDHQARHLLAARLLVSGDSTQALEHLLEMMRRDRSYEDDLGRRSLVQAFSIVEDQALINDVRSRMSSLLF